MGTTDAPLPVCGCTDPIFQMECIGSEGNFLGCTHEKNDNLCPQNCETVGGILICTCNACPPGQICVSGNCIGLPSFASLFEGVELWMEGDVTADELFSFIA